MATDIGVMQPENGAATGQQDRHANMAGGKFRSNPTRISRVRAIRGFSGVGGNGERVRSIGCCAVVHDVAGRWLMLGVLVAVWGLALAKPVSAAESATVSEAQAKKIVDSVCIACHGADGNGVTPKIPRLAGLSREYLTKQLKDFISGKRKHDMMTAIAATLKLDEIGALAAYFGKLKPRQPTVPDARLAEEGKRLFIDGNESTGLPGCDGCHGADAAGGALVPRLAGQSKEYMMQQLDNFNNGIRTNDTNRFMQVVAQRMTEEEMSAVTEYLSGLEVRQ